MARLLLKRVRRLWCFVFGFVLEEIFCIHRFLFYGADEISRRSIYVILVIVLKF